MDDERGGGGGGPASGSGRSNLVMKDEVNTAVVVFARLPVPGRVKTRLAAGAGVGPDGACDFYRACAQHAIHQAASCSQWADAAVYHSSADATVEVASWLSGEGLAVRCVPQIGFGGGSGSGSCGPAAPASSFSAAAAPEPDLGAKMLAAMTDARRRVGQPAKVLITGTDIPDISSDLLRRAADALDEHEMVIGPSLDGGYYLLGLTRLEPRLFEGMLWSTGSVLEETLARAASAGLRTAPLTTLPPLRDVDTVEDLAEWVASRADRATEAGVDNQQEPQQGGSGTSGAACGNPSPSPPPPLPAAVEADEQALRRQRQLLAVSRRVLRGAAAVAAAASTAAAAAGS